MIADGRTRSISKIPYYSTGTLNELELDGYCDFGFPIGSSTPTTCDEDDYDEYCDDGGGDGKSPSNGGGGGSSSSSSSTSTSTSTSSPSSVATWSFASTLPRVTSSKLDLRNSRLDEVIRAFARAFARGGGVRDVDAGRLLRACRAHLDLMRSVGGSALCLVARDLENNLRKAEAVYHTSPGKFPTLTSLLEHERDTPGVHPPGGCLGETSAAMGLLWIRRSLAFQSHLFESLIPSPPEEGAPSSGGITTPPSPGENAPTGRHPRDAANEAYQLHLAPYHGWMLRAAFPASLSQMPHRDVFLSKFGEVGIDDLDRDMEYKIVRKLGALVSTLEPLLMLWRECFERLDLEDNRRV
ncbi:hypothetical protein ACHAXA_009484 [Cyclostephanos tholiformis]|uniref:Glycolipid transfer protein domain-containing protein n=1 Tax=Cyclostephanos tholiformis TaxID=382380 RepID=A0ABD3RBP7_9STRA